MQLLQWQLLIQLLTGFTTRDENMGLKLPMDKFSTSLIQWLKMINSSSIMKPNKKGMSKNCGQKMKAKQDNTD